MCNAKGTNEIESGWYVESSEEEENGVGDADEFNNFIPFGSNFSTEISGI